MILSLLELHTALRVDRGLHRIIAIKIPEYQNTRIFIMNSLRVPWLSYPNKDKLSISCKLQLGWIYIAREREIIKFCVYKIPAEARQPPRLSLRTDLHTYLVTDLQRGL